MPYWKKSAFQNEVNKSMVLVFFRGQRGAVFLVVVSFFVLFCVVVVLWGFFLAGALNLQQ